MDLVEAYSNNLGQFLFVVGKITQERKQNREFLNIKPQGWLILSNSRKRRKNGKKSGMQGQIKISPTF